MPKKFLSVNDVARILGVTPLTIRNWDKRGRLSAYRNPLNNYRMYKVEDVELLLKKIEGSRKKEYTEKAALPDKPKVRKLK